MSFNFPDIDQDFSGTKELICKVWTCDMNHHYHVMMTWYTFEMLRQVLGKLGIVLQVQKESFIPPCDHEKHRLLYALQSLHTVQGLKWEEGTTIIEGLESLIAKYVDLKNGRA